MQSLCKALRALAWFLLRSTRFGGRAMLDEATAEAEGVESKDLIYVERDRSKLINYMVIW